MWLPELAEVLSCSQCTSAACLNCVGEDHHLSRRKAASGCLPPIVGRLVRSAVQGCLLSRMCSLSALQARSDHPHYHVEDSLRQSNHNGYLRPSAQVPVLQTKHHTRHCESQCDCCAGSLPHGVILVQDLRACVNNKQMYSLGDFDNLFVVSL
jgi:hypothetical protein